ncbi:MAG: hypothetical protein DRJ26_00500 [Candidatus Methanomethylicota archaeon]|uniref:Uncharacterized protein n=1 Tax=Thermoproteota archaeon TaxID=2056631 RepID=A0A497EWS4_9CREN|nr:MAG: hypothetical protein DRJ20_02165 [Candidatus Verstraetearchaeota archaeon]RLE55695.1 MAG: hypothetical protein DRJ26_00500 [Candidatus Verstraetearchaeota archaeon]
MRGVELACAMYFYKSNLGLLFPSIKASEETLEKITELAKISEKVNKRLAELGAKRNLKVTSAVGYSEFAGKELEVAYLSIGDDFTDVEYILRPIFIELGGIGLERPTVSVFAFYHPPIKVVIDDVAGWITPQGISLKEIKNLGTPKQLQINIYNVDFNLAKSLFKAIIRCALCERAISVPSEKAVEAYTEKVTRKLSNREKTQIVMGIREIAEGIVKRVSDLSSDLEADMKEELSEADSILKALIK